MTNEEWLNKKLGKTYDSIDAGEKIDYLLKQVEWMQKYLSYTYPIINDRVGVNCIDDNDNELYKTGSCLLEAIENAQEEMNNV